MRYFLRLSYFGTSYVGWQSQPNGVSVQSTIESALTTLFQKELHIVGCGRTDAGVHASAFYAHFDWPDTLPDNIQSRLNKLLPSSIAIQEITRFAKDHHARHDATSRTYHYYIIRHKDPFRIDRAYHFYGFERLDKEKMQLAANLLLKYEAFFPFCKTRSGADHYRCKLAISQWTFSEDEMKYEIKANRFLRGMVRLIVGMCLQVGQNKISLGEVAKALDEQKQLSQRLSVPAHGLYLTTVAYPFL